MLAKAANDFVNLSIRVYALNRSAMGTQRRFTWNLHTHPSSMRS
jgi:hypothetical protein